MRQIGCIVLLADGVCLCALVYFTKQIFPLGYISAVLGIASFLVGAGALFSKDQFYSKLGHHPFRAPLDRHWDARPRAFTAPTTYRQGWRRPPPQHPGPRPTTS